MLRLGGAQVPLQFLELLDNNIGPAGASALGRSLAARGNMSLLTLRLDYNPNIGAEGCILLCR